VTPLPTPRRRPPLAPLVLALAVAASCFADGPAERAAGGPGSAGAARAEAGPPVPEFRLRGADGRDHSPSDLRGKVVLYEFWATWCAPCHLQVEILKRLYPDAARRGIEFVAIASGEPVEVVTRHLERSPYPYPVVFDPEDRVGTAMEVLGLPTLVVADREGRVVWRHTGLVDAETIEAALAEAGAPARAGG
jgi:peroxiredoxin